MESQQDCIFCKIIRKEIPAVYIHEDDQVIAMLDLHPVNPGHALVIPKNHSDDMLSASDADLAAIVTYARKVAAAVIKVTGAAGFNLHVNTGKAAGQAIAHTHFHVIPRYSADGLVQWHGKEAKPGTREELADQIRKLL